MASAAQLRQQIDSSLAAKHPGARLALAPRLVLAGGEAGVQTGFETLDSLLAGGLPMSGTSEIVGGRSSGRATVASAYLAQRTREGHVCAWIDVGGDGSPEALMADGADLPRLLWVRCVGSGEREIPNRQSALVPRLAGLYVMPAEPGGATLRERVRTKPGTPSAPNRPLASRSHRVEQVATDRQPARRGMAVLAEKNGPPVTPAALPTAPTRPFAPAKKPWSRLEQAIKAVDLLLQGGGFGAIVLDLGSIAPQFARRIPLATWFRWRAAGERNRTALIVLTEHGCTGSSAELHLRLEAELPRAGKVLEGISYRLQVVRRRFAPDEGAAMDRRRKPPARAASAWESRAGWAS